MIKRHQRSTDNIELSNRADQTLVEFRLCDPIAIFVHWCVCVVVQKQQVTFCERVQNREIHLFTLLPKPFDQWLGIELTIIGKIQGNTLRGSHFR
ncbi:Uncharacterised protein [Vibrio cholerae]|nr:Uncharacterised protein [Vibrio cholerae]